MKSLKARLPGLNGLLVFEAAARHLGFTRAAGELHVSQAAVSRQIRRLESQLGTPLFRRRHRAIELTEAGLRLRDAVAMGFGHIDGVVREIRASSQSSQIQVATTVAFATYWLMPRLNAFRQRHPGVDVRVLASDRHQDHLADGVDLALVCGNREALGWRADRLFTEVVFPVCSPDYLAAHPLARFDELPRHTLLHLDDRHWEDIGWKPVDWALWLEQFGITYRAGHPVITFNNYPMLVEAALDGQGLALGWRHLSESLLRQGRLVRPVAEEWDFRRGYFIALREQPEPAPETTALRDWLRRDASADG